MTHHTSTRARLAAFFDDPLYFRQLVRFALPIALQNAITASLNMVGVMMIGQMGATPVAGVGLASQVAFLLQLVLFGITSGSAIFTAQLWGKGDLPNLRRVLSLALGLCLTAGLFFFGLSVLAPEVILGVYSKDPAVIVVGSEYLSLFGWSFLFLSVTICFGVIMRSIGEVRIPVIISIAALALNTLLSYLLIFGHLGLPEMGVRGAAVAAVITRAFETIALLSVIYIRKLPLAVHLSDFLSLNLDFTRRVLKPVIPVILNETFWAFGITAYFVIYARMDTDAIAAMNIIAPIENLAFVLMFGIAHATSIMVGNRIGAGNEDEANRYAGRSLTLATIGGALMGVLVWFLAPLALSFYKVPQDVLDSAQQVIGVMAILMWLRAANPILIVGILRSGGDTTYSFFLDGVLIWVVGVPMAYIAAFVLELPVHLVYLAAMSEEFLKWALGLRRYFSRKWIHNLARTI